MATVFEYLQWRGLAAWTLHLTVVLVGLAVIAAPDVYVWGYDPDADVAIGDDPGDARAGGSSPVTRAAPGDRLSP